MALKTLVNIKTLFQLAGDEKFQRGMKYFLNGHVSELKFATARHGTAVVTGAQEYKVEIKETANKLEFQCACPSFEKDGVCKHCVAAGIAIIEGKEFVTINSARAAKLIVSVEEFDNAHGENPGAAFRGVGGEKVKKKGCLKSGVSYIQTNSGIVLWGKSPVKELLKCFDAIEIKKGYSLDGYYFMEGMGGNFRPVVIKSSGKLPAWENVNSNPVFHREDCPIDTDVDINKYIAVSGTPESYFQKAVFMKQLFDIGAFWHGCSDWGVRNIVLNRQEVISHHSNYPGLITKAPVIPAHMDPKVMFSADGKRITLEHYYFSHGLGGTVGLFVRTIKYNRDGLGTDVKSQCALDLGAGPTP